MATLLKLPPKQQNMQKIAHLKRAAIAPATTSKSKLAPPAALRKRHYGIGISFIACVLLPIGVAALYLYAIALPQYASTVGFSIRDESAHSSLDILGGLTELSGSASKDADILYAFLQSQKIVENISKDLDIKAIWSNRSDPIFTLKSNATIEDTHRFWQRMIRISYDANAGLIEVRTHAFTSEDATLLANTILQHSITLTNNLADVARHDSVLLAQNNFENAQNTLKYARRALSDFRKKHHFFDPQSDIERRLGLLNSLQAQKAQALIDYDLLLSAQTRSADPRIGAAQRRIHVVETLIAKERAARGGPDDMEYAGLLADYEALTVDLEFAQAAYLSSRAHLQATRADAARVKKYLAVHIDSTHAQRAEYPQKALLLCLLTAGLITLWAIGLLIYYSIRDRR